MDKILDEVKAIDKHYQNQIKDKQKQIDILKAEIEQLYEVINSIQSIGELINVELDKMKEGK